MLSKRNNKGFTLAETLLVVLIIVIITAVSFVSVIAYQRNMTKLEFDGYAKEIFIAAQNHLTMLEGQGYFGLEGDALGEPEGDGSDGIYYFVVNVSGRTAVTAEGTVLNLMLPFASVDDTVRTGGQYIVRYHKDSAQVLDVFYWSDHASPARFSHDYNDDYATFLTLLETYKDDPDGLKKALKEYGTRKSVIGYYGGVEAASLTHGSEIKTPTIKVINAESLYVEVTNPSAGATNLQLKLVITGKTSKVSREVVCSSSSSSFTYALDDITETGKRFSKQFCSDEESSKNLIPGEDIEIYAVAFNNSEYSNVAYSATKTTNSLFADGTDAATAKIAYFRHLENLDNTKSNLSFSGEKIHITKAEQITDLEWEKYTGSMDNYFTTGAAHPAFDYVPVSPSYALEYSGVVTGDTVIHSISNLTISASGSAGVFGELVSNSKVSNLKLVDLTVSGTDAGALAGKTTAATVTNVLAYNTKAFDTDNGTAATISGSGDVGGLIGSVAGGTISKSAAALVVKSTGGDAGGLIGSVSDGTVAACYSGGHTTNGNYISSAFNVTSTATAGKAGGLIGDAGSATITNSYSTCSASGATVGGFVGTASGKITDCYATGLIGGGTSAKGAFGGTLSGQVSGSHYYKIINETPVADGAEGYTYLKAVNSADKAGITAFDESTSDFNSFVGGSDGWEPAAPYDTRLFIYKGKYSLDGLKVTTGVDATDFVATHYGDWPAPEIWIVNN